MKYSKQQMIEGLEISDWETNEEIERYSKIAMVDSHKVGLNELSEEVSKKKKAQLEELKNE